MSARALPDATLSALFAIIIIIFIIIIIIIILTLIIAVSDECTCTAGRNSLCPYCVAMNGPGSVSR